MKLILIGIVILLVSCSRHYPAPVTDARSKKVRSTQSFPKQKIYKPKFVTVKKGDTLYSIGFSQSVDYKYLAQINNVSRPYHIYPGQVLRLIKKKSTAKNKVNNTVNNTTIKTHPLKIKKSHAQNAKIVKNTNKAVVSTPMTKPLIKPQNKPQIKPPVKVLAQKSPIIKKTTAKPTVNANQQVAPRSNSRWIWPVKGKIISTFSTTDVTRKGIDISSPIGKSVYASNNGTVVYSGDGLLGYGELIIIKHSNNLLSAYAHNSSRLVKEGVVVKQGQQIAKSGKGTDGTPLLHFEIRKSGQPVNPMKYLPVK